MLGVYSSPTNSAADARQLEGLWAFSDRLSYMELGLFESCSYILDIKQSYLCVKPPVTPVILTLTLASLLWLWRLTRRRVCTTIRIVFLLLPPFRSLLFA
jgi:hypothetical protein